MSTFQLAHAWLAAAHTSGVPEIALPQEVRAA